MKTQPRFRLSGWVAGSLIGLVVANFFLVLFVTGVDVFLGQPPQFMVPLFALMIASVALALSHRRRAQSESNISAKTDRAATTASPWSRRRRPNAPAYIAMTIIRRPPVLASSGGDNHWKGVVQ
jgi:hypothetical protein